MLGALSKREEELLKNADGKKAEKKVGFRTLFITMFYQKRVKYEAPEELEEGAGPLQWDHGLGKIEREKSKALSILGQIVPQAEIFLKTSSGSNTIKQGPISGDPIKKQI